MSSTTSMIRVIWLKIYIIIILLILVKRILFTYFLLISRHLRIFISIWSFKNFFFIRRNHSKMTNLSLRLLGQWRLIYLLILHYEFRLNIFNIKLINYSLLWKWTLAIFLTISSPFIFWITILAIPIFIIVKSLWYFLLSRMIPMIIIGLIHFLRSKIFNSSSFIRNWDFIKSFFLENSLLLIKLWISVENFSLFKIHINFGREWPFWISILMTEVHGLSSRIIVGL